MAGSVLPTLLGLCLLISPLGRSLAILSFDLLFLFRPASDPATLDDVVILVMDEDSRVALSQNPNGPWDRAVHARLLRELTARRAKVVAFDVLFDDPSADPAADEQLGAAIRQHGRVVLATSVHSARHDGLPTSKMLRPANTLGSNALWGVVEVPVEAGPAAALRRQFNYADFTNLAWQVAVAFGKAPAHRLTTRWLNYYGPEGTLPTVSYHRAFGTNLLPRDFFADKAVFIGKSGIITADGQSLDRYATPFSRWRAGSGQIPGVELQATAFLNLVHKDWLEELSPLTELLLVCFLGALFGFGLPRLQPWHAAVGALAGMAIISAAAIALAWTTHRWFPWLIISAVQIPCAFGISVLLHTLRLTREKETLEKDIALAESVSSLPALLGAAVAAADQDQPPPIPNHKLLRRIGRGAYGEVWLALDDIGAYHAVKIVYQRNFRAAAPYDREFRGIQKFTPLSRNHPGLIHILHVGRSENHFFCIMELGDDEHSGQRIDAGSYSPNTLARQIETRGHLPVAECVQLGLDLTAALEYLHQQNLIHRDIKPSNIIFVNGAPKFADIGLVTDIAPDAKKSTLVGTEGYLPPEGPGTPAGDIYSLGKVLYEVCTGQDRQQFPSLPGSLLASGGPEFVRLNEIILKACHAQAKQRFRSAAEMQAELLKVCGK